METHQEETLDSREIKISNNYVINPGSRSPSTKGDSFYSEDKTGVDTTIDFEKSKENIEKKYLTRSPIDFERNRFPFCIVWTPLPLISWVIPIIGHTGICT